MRYFFPDCTSPFIVNFHTDAISDAKAGAAINTANRGTAKLGYNEYYGYNRDRYKLVWLYVSMC